MGGTMLQYGSYTLELLKILLNIKITTVAITSAMNRLNIIRENVNKGNIQ